MLDASPDRATLASIPGNRLERLQQHCVGINEQWRICFEWKDGDAYEVEITDYR